MKEVICVKKFGYLLSAMVICGGCLFGCASDKEQVEESQTVQEDQTKEGVVTPETETPKVEEKEEVEVPIVEESNNEIKIGEHFYKYDSDGNKVGEVTITQAQWTDYRNEYWDNDLEQPVTNVLYIEYEYTNLGVKDYSGNDTEWSFSEFNFDIYNDSNRKLEFYPTPMDAPYDGLVSKGRTGVGSTSFAVFDDCKHFEMEVGDLILYIDLD